jgi:hypothetical protein
MLEMPKENEIALTLAALRIRASYHAARAMMLRGEMRGRQVGRLWFVDASDVERLERERGHGIAQPA